VLDELMTPRAGVRHGATAIRSGGHAEAWEGCVPDEEVVATLVHRAADGDEAAWSELVARYAPLVWSVCRHYRLERSDVDDVAQGVWLLLLESLPKLRVPAALPGWLVTTTRRECLRTARRVRARVATEVVLAPELVPDREVEALDEVLLDAERRAVLRTAFAELAERCRRLLTLLLLADPPASYVDISVELDMPVGSIGPTRARCLDGLRRTPSLAAFLAAGAGSTS
jgi:RNA polymerase sigma factor (sigma-70 family)